jgi:aspartyl-tRNA(Asn)/glutamyl-tRNA(Gln) amidotransferase subunit A
MVLEASAMTVPKLEALSLQALHDHLRSGNLTSKSLVAACLDRIDELNPTVGAFLSVDHEHALAAASDSDRQRRAGVDLGPLMGMPVAIKDIFVVAGTETRAGSPSNMSDRIGPEGSFVGRLRELGCIIVGKTRTTEFAFSPSGLNEHIGVPRNPAMPDAPHLTGGSSAGSAAAVAAGMVPLAIGSDTGGSVRVPAALCGVAGLKTTPGLWATDGVFSLSSTLDTIGLFARSAFDLAYAFAAIESRPALADAEQPAQLGIGVGYFLEELEPAVSSAFDRVCQRLGDKGVQLIPVDLPEAAERAPALVQIMAYELTQNLGRDYLQAEHRFSDPYVEARVKANLDISAERYATLIARREELQRVVERRLHDLPFWITPTVPVTAPAAPEKRDIPAEMTLNLRLTQDTQPINLFGLCAASIPIPGCPAPVGLQLIGPAQRDDDLLALAMRLDQILRNG